MYGFTGATIGRLPCLAISSSVTSYGREMIERTKLEVETEYCIKKGREHDAEVIYGDTDSVMIRFGTPDLESTMALGTHIAPYILTADQALIVVLGAEAAEYVTTKFVRPIKLEFEKVYFPYLLISKKRYAGLYWTNPKKYDKMDTKGIEVSAHPRCKTLTPLTHCFRLFDETIAGLFKRLSKPACVKCSLTAT